MPSPGATKIYLKDVAVQESGDKMGEHELRLPSVSPLKINEEVEERLQKQQHELEQLKTSLQSKVYIFLKITKHVATERTLFSDFSA